MTLGAESGVPFCSLSSHSVADVKFGKSEKYLAIYVVCLNRSSICVILTMMMVESR